MLQPSIRWKLTLWYGLILGLLLFAFSAAVYWTARHRLLLNLDRELAEELSDVQVEVKRSESATKMLAGLDQRFARHEGFDFQIVQADGARIFASERLVDLVLPAPTSEGADPSFETVTIESVGRWRVASEKFQGPDGSLRIQVAQSLTAFERESRELLWAFLLAGPLTVAATLAGGYFLARRTLAPVQRITETARQISAEQLSQRVAVANHDDELGRLATTLNDMFDRLERSFTEMKQFTADAAHELRTPLAVIRNEAEVALRQPRSGDEYGDALENVLEETIRLSRLADELLFLCRQDAGLNSQASGRVELGLLLQEVVGNMRLVAQEKGITLIAEVSGTVWGDCRQIRRVFYNLIDNALKYTPAGGQIQISSRDDGGKIVVIIADTGIGIPAECLPRIFDRFYRIDPSRHGDEGGAGLGLSICKSVVQAVGGTISVASTVGSGTEFAVSLRSCRDA